MCNCNRTNISTTLVPPGTALVNTYIVDITRRLCMPICTNSSPIANIIMHYVGLDLIDATSGIYNAIIQVSGTITYQPLNGGQCSQKTEIISGEFYAPVTSATGIASVSVAQGPLIVSPIAGSGCGCQSAQSCDISASLLVTATAAA